MPGRRDSATGLGAGVEPVVPPLRTRLDPWKYDRETFKRRSEIERFFRRLKGLRRTFSRFEKLDVVFLEFIVFTLVVWLRECEQDLVRMSAKRDWDNARMSLGHLPARIRREHGRKHGIN